MSLARFTPPIPPVPQNSPDIKDPSVQRFFEAVRGSLILLTGQQGIVPKTAVLTEDLVSLGFAERLNTRSGYSISPIIPTGDTTEDLSPPPTPTNLTLSAAISLIMVEFGGFSLTDDNVDRTEVYRSTVNDIDTAVNIGSVFGYMFSDATVTTGTTYYYWVRNISSAGIPSPFNSLIGTGISLSDTPQAVVDSLVSQISLQQTTGGSEVLKVNADLFAIETIDNNGDIDYPFIIDNVDGQPKIVLNGAAYIPDISISSAKIQNAAVENTHIDDAQVQTVHIDDAQIVAAHIQDLSVNTLKIGPNAVFASVCAIIENIVSSSMDWIEIASTYIDPNGSGIFFVIGVLHNPSPAYQGVTYRLVKPDNTVIYFCPFVGGARVTYVNSLSSAHPVYNNVNNAAWPYPTSYDGTGNYYNGVSGIHNLFLPLAPQNSATGVYRLEIVRLAAGLSANAYSAVASKPEYAAYPMSIKQVSMSVFGAKR